MAFDAIVATIKIGATPLLALYFGFIEMLSNTKANVTGTFVICLHKCPNNMNKAKPETAVPHYQH